MSRDPEPPPDLAVGQRLWDEQSLRNAFVASFIVIFMFTLFWAMLTALIGRSIPLLTLLLGAAVGLAVRRAGLGLSWPYPLIAAVMALFGSVVSGVLVAATVIADEIGSTTSAVLFEYSPSLSAFVGEVLSPSDYIFAAGAAGIAAFYAMRKLTRRQYLAFRLWKDSR